jgi:hypothetical protein|tara:strand:- start:2794 stop:3120 length:327 start_codon:yes stop_codon:yes gene_type:complete
MKKQKEIIFENILNDMNNHIKYLEEIVFESKTIITSLTLTVNDIIDILIHQLNLDPGESNLEKIPYQQQLETYINSLQSLSNKMKGFNEFQKELIKYNVNLSETIGES